MNPELSSLFMKELSIMFSTRGRKSKSPRISAANGSP